jgi:hypothetical protein
MNRLDIQRLQAARGYPAVSILMPTHRTAPENQQDPIRLKNLINRATDRLLGEFQRRELEPIFTRLDGIVGEIDFRRTLDGLAVFVNHDTSLWYQLPLPLRERVVIDETFATRDLVHAMNRSPRYWVLALSEQPTRLYEGLRDDLVEVTNGGFPLTHGGPGGESKLPGGVGVRTSAYRDEYHRKFFRDVDAALGKVLADDPLPVALVGVDRYLAFFNEVSRNKGAVVTALTGSHDTTPAHELAKLVWPLVEANLVAQRKLGLQELEAAVSTHRYASGINEVWYAAHEGRGSTLIVEEGFHYPARLDQAGRQLTPADDPEAPGVIDDAVDELIEMVMAKGGRVVFEDDGTLERYERIAMILRY